MTASCQAIGPSFGRKCYFERLPYINHIADNKRSENINGWAGLIKVDGKVYNWMGGAPGPPTADQLGMTYTATKTEFLLNVAGKVEMSVKFLSPVTPEDMRRQSIPFSYLDVAVRSLDRNSHKVQIYTDVTGGKYKTHELAHMSAMLISDAFRMGFR